MQLISMTDFVLINWQNHTETKDACKHNTDSLTQIVNYAKFLNKPLTLGMFIPCDEEGNVLEEPKTCCSGRDCGCMGMPYNYISQEELEEYYEAESNVLFDGFMLIHIHNKKYKQALVAKDKEGKGQFDIYDYETIEDLVFMDLTLTPNAIKQLGL